jgi:hypothetical protein
MGHLYNMLFGFDTGIAILALAGFELVATVWF